MWWLIRELFKQSSRFKSVETEIKARQKFELKHRAAIEDYQLTRFNELWQFACSNVPYYKNLQCELNLPLAFYSLQEMAEKVPILEKQTIQMNPKQFLPEQLPPGFWASTSGSTGTPMKCYWEASAYLESQRDKYYHQDLWGIDLWDKTATIWGFSHFFDETWRGKVKFIRDKSIAKVRNKIVFSVYQVSQQNLKAWYRQIRQQQVRFLYALPNFAYLLAKSNEAERPLKALKLIVVGGEPLFQEQKAVIERVCGCPVAIEYGTIEIGLLAAEYPDAKMHVCERGVLLETLPVDHNFFEIIVTNFRNKGFPLIRYRIGDLTDAPLTPSDRGTATIGCVIGRVRDVFKNASGEILNGLVFSRFFKDFPEIIQYQVIQETHNWTTVRLVCSKPLSEKARSTITQKLSKVLGKDTSLQLEEVEEIKLTRAGKHRFIISKITV